MSDFVGLAKDFIEETERLSSDKVLLLLEEYLAKGMDINATLEYCEKDFGENAGVNLLSMLVISNDYEYSVADAVAFNIKLIDFFTGHGFDFSKCNWLFSARCLLMKMTGYVDFEEAEIAFYTGRYMLQNGAKSVAAKCYDEAAEAWQDMCFADEVIWDLALVAAYESNWSYDLETESILYAYLLIIRLNRLGLPYEQIGLYPESYGKRITAVFSRSGDFSIPVSANCCETGLHCGITASLYFALDNGNFLVCSINDTEDYAEREMHLFVDGAIPSEAFDVSEKFVDYIGKRIESVSFKRKEKDMDPVVDIVTDCGIIQVVS